MHEDRCFDAELFDAFELDLCESAIGEFVEFFGEFFFEGLYGFLHVVDGHFGAVYGGYSEECVLVSGEDEDILVADGFDEVVVIHVCSLVVCLLDYIAGGRRRNLFLRFLVMSVEEYRVCKTCGKRLLLNTSNFDRERGGLRKQFYFRRECKRCSYAFKSLKATESSSPEAYLWSKWYALSRRRRSRGIEVCPSLAGREGLSYLMDLWSAQRGLCALTGMPMTWGRVKRGDIKAEGYGRVVGIDRIDSSVGYVRGNLQLVCGQVNYMRGGLSEDDFLEWCAAVVEGRVAPFC